MTRYFVYDVFSQKAFGGNPLAVIPDATGLPEGDLQKIAREFNFSETTFVFPPKDPSHQASVRIFTPTMEIPFAGHPVIGTAIALIDEGAPTDMTLELGIGPVTCAFNDNQAQFTTAAVLDIMAHPSADMVAKTLGLRRTDIITDTHAPVMATLGLPFTLTEVVSKNALSRIEVNVEAMRVGATKFPASLDFAQFAYVRDGNKVHARMFAPLDNIPEDPATGSACATLGALLADLTKQDITLSVMQGEDMGRPSRIGVKTRAGAVTISGQAKRVMTGQLVY